jgi:succinoglycan biosynthesis transport protein ExoP
VHQDSEELNLKQVLGAVRRRAPLILLCFVLAAGAAFAVSKHEAKKYTATALVGFGSNSLTQEVTGLPSSSTAGLAAQQASQVESAKVGDAAAKTATRLGHGLTAAEVAGSVSVGAVGESGVIGIAATTSSPKLAAAIANTYSQEFVKEQLSANHQYFSSALALVEKQLATIPLRQRFSAATAALQNRAQTLRLLSELNYDNVQVAQEAALPTEPSSPKTSRNTLIGAILGLFLGLGLAFLLERIDRRIKGPEDVEEIYRLPMLGGVPESAALARSGRADRSKGAGLPAGEAEAFNLIRAHLRFFNVDRDLRTLVVASAAPGDGKTTIAHRLAEAAARSGSRVLLVEADLRHPTLARQFDIQAGPGLADVLIGELPMGEATQSVDLDVSSGTGTKGRKLDVLLAGAVLPPNPAALLESEAMEGVLEQAKSTYDLVVIDTPPLTAVSDGFPLLTKVDGVVIVSRVGRSRRDAAEQLRKVLDGSGVPLLGVVVNGSKSAGGIAASYARAKNDKAPPVVASTNGSVPSADFVPNVRG